MKTDWESGRTYLLLLLNWHVALLSLLLLYYIYLSYHIILENKVRSIYLLLKRWFVIYFIIIWSPYHRRWYWRYIMIIIGMLSRVVVVVVQMWGCAGVQWWTPLFDSRWPKLIGTGRVRIPEIWRLIGKVGGLIYYYY